MKNRQIACTFTLIGIVWTNLLSMYACGKERPPTDSLRLVIDSVLTIFHQTQPLLTYQFNTVYPPEGQDSSYQRSGFIHPVRTLKGEQLTRIQPADHYHHYGIWNPWTQTVFRGDTVDFWNLRKKEGTVRFARILDHEVEGRTASYTVQHNHVVFGADGREETALEERQMVRLHVPDGQQSYYWIDIRMELECATVYPLRLLSYRYGGLGWRAVASWGPENSSVLTSEGNTRGDTDGSRARWCMVQGGLGENGYGGMAILSHPDNFNHPEPLRIWDSEANKGRENVFINFSPTKDRDWLLEPGYTYVLQYRLVVFDGMQDAQAMEGQWLSFATKK